MNMNMFVNGFRVLLMTNTKVCLWKDGNNIGNNSGDITDDKMDGCKCLLNALWKSDLSFIACYL